MTISVTFESLEELKNFARDILKEENVSDGEKTTSALTCPQPADTAPAATAPVTAVPVAPVSVTTVTPAGYVPPVTQPSVPLPSQPAPVPTTAQAYTLDDLARAAMTLMDSGRQIDLQQLLSQFGVEALPALPQAQYGAFATALRGMGAQI